jgi:hypothetical protein
MRDRLDAVDGSIAIEASSDGTLVTARIRLGGAA